MTWVGRGRWLGMIELRATRPRMSLPPTLFELRRDKPLIRATELVRLRAISGFRHRRLLPAAGKSLDHRAHRIARLAVLHGIEQRRGTRGAANQAFGIGEYQRIVPWALHHEGQLKALVAAVGRRRQAGDALEVVFAGRH